MAKQIKKKYIANDAIDGNKILLDVGQSIRQSDGSGGEIDVIQTVYESVDADFVEVKGGVELIEGSVAPHIYADEAIPESSFLKGWKYKKANENVGVVGGRKINWYFFNDNADHNPLLPPSDLGFEKGITIADLQAGQFSFSGIFEEMDNGQFLLQVYTKPRTGDTGWYHSRQTYSINPKDLGIEGMRKLFYIVNAPSSNPEGLDELEIPLASTAYHSGTQVQDVQGTDELKLIAIASNSIAPIGTEMYVDRVIVSMGAHSYDRRLTSQDEANIAGLMVSSQNANMDLKSVLESADSGLQSQIDSILSNTDPAALDSLSEVVTAFQNADNNLNGAISSLSTSLSGAIDTEVAARTAGDSALQTSINNEAATRLEVDTKILDSIKKEVFFETEAQIMGVSPDAGVPIANPNDATDEGWFFDKSLPGAENKINWYFHYKSQAPVHLDENGLSVYFTSVVETGYIFLGVYTSPEGDGNDASSWYRSRLSLTYDNAEVTLGQEYLFWAFNEPSADIRPELTRIELTPRVSSIQRGPAGAAFLADGTRLDEMLDRVAINTDSGDSATRVRVYDAGIQGEKYEKEIAFRIKDRVTLDEVMSLSLQKSSMDAQRSEYLKLYTDYLYGLNQAGISQEVTDRTNADSNLQSQIDNILSNTDPAALDSLSEIVGAFQQADSDLSGAITSLSTSLSGAVDTEVAARIAGDNTLQSQIDSIVAGSVSFAKESVTITQAMLDNEYVDLQALSRENSMVIFVGRLALIEGSDYSVSTQGGVSRITFLAPMLTPSEEALEVDQVLSIKYAV